MKKIGILVEGMEEQIALRHIVEKLAIEGVQILKPVFANMQPKGPAAQIVKAVEAKMSLLQKADAILVLIDKEDTDDCIITRVGELRNAFHKKGHRKVEVVIKNRQFENWLIADPEAINQLSNFEVTSAFRKKVEQDKTDHVQDPVGLLSGLKKGGSTFHKTKDGTEIAKKLNVENAARNSRSLRRFLRLLEHPDYKDQSKKPKQPLSF